MLMKTTAAHSSALQGTSGIILDSLRVAYHGNVVLKPLSLTIEPGEVLALIGPSGSGKNHGTACGGGGLPSRRAVVF
ncbi:putative amino-acid ABC transporter ATP-binding protein YecC [Kluyvera cryocrescens]|uniref:Putative amino-acid ABC transporter ATP-binding protein YecC n=1 Tax=Kluyvera cryocrescens TaxID=580 RepID=A0A485B1T8_KLUCR|nr:putative amino-acid ABC transporter ATP-binding protein YecC [Kluyvera cryocrescens]